jgi:coenzyme F420-0:L-glutamate ligase/coenzyme F420-1:gamma-L-glutamate ligase
MLPSDPDASAEAIRKKLLETTQAEVGVLIIDSHGRAWRFGTVGTAIGMAGFPALLDLRGRPDLFGNALKTTQVGLADELASAASIIMGQADEGCPVVHVRGLPYPLREGSLAEILRPEEEDLFR